MGSNQGDLSEETKLIRVGAIQIQKIFGKNTAFPLCMHAGSKTLPLTPLNQMTENTLITTPTCNTKQTGHRLTAPHAILGSPATDPKSLHVLRLGTPVRRGPSIRSAVAH